MRMVGNNFEAPSDLDVARGVPVEPLAGPDADLPPGVNRTLRLVLDVQPESSTRIPQVVARRENSGIRRSLLGRDPQMEPVRP